MTGIPHRALLLPLAFLLLASPARAQQAEGVTYGTVTMGQSTKMQVESFLRERLACFEHGVASNGLAAEYCFAEANQSPSNPQVLLVGGRVMILRILLSPGLTAYDAVASLESKYGPLLNVSRPSPFDPGGLRLWEFDVRPGRMVLAENQHRTTGEIRLRLTIEAPAGDWEVEKP